MALSELLDGLSADLRELKEQVMATDPEHPDLSIYLHFWRGDALIAAVQCPLERDDGLRAAYIGATGFNADVMAFSFESYYAHTMKSPLTGQDWVHQEMQYVAETYPDRTDWVSECITTHIHDRNNQFAFRSMAYTLKDGQVSWLKDQDVTHSSEEVEATEFDGVIPYNLRKAMDNPKSLELVQEAATKEPALAMLVQVLSDPELRLFHSDMAVLKALKEHNVAFSVALFAEPGSDREQWLNERLGKQ